jgi:hypothetical protein
MMKKTIFNRHYGGTIGILLMLCSGAAAAASTSLSEALDAALEDYCVPKCTSGCSELFIAEYDPGTGECKCKNGLTYDSAFRECTIKCPAGTYAWSGPGCPAGMYASQGKGCPAGSYRLGNTDEHGVMAEAASCPSYGFFAKKIQSEETD